MILNPLSKYRRFKAINFITIIHNRNNTKGQHKQSIFFFFFLFTILKNIPTTTLSTRTHAHTHTHTQVERKRQEKKKTAPKMLCILLLCVIQFIVCSFVHYYYCYYYLSHHIQVGCKNIETVIMYKLLLCEFHMRNTTELRFEKERAAQNVKNKTK